MKTYVVDTHALAWYLDDDPRLGSQAEAVLDNDDVRSSATHPSANSSNLPRVGRPFLSQPAIS